MTYGSDFIYDGDRLAGGVEGTWTDVGTATGTRALSANKDALQLDLTALAGDNTLGKYNGTALGISPAIFTTVQWRYRTTGNAKATIRLVYHSGTPATDQYVLNAQSSSSWTKGFATIASTGGTGGVLDYIYFYATTGVGRVDFDFIEISKGIFTFPNVVEMLTPAIVNNAPIGVPGMSGALPNRLGNQLMEITMTCDTDMESAGRSWKRAGDFNNIDVLLENSMEGGQTNLQGTRPWEWLDLGNPTIQMKANLVEIRPSYKGDGDGNLVTLKFREYRRGGANGVESVTERYGLNL
jgi:hypothetical protein